jgi:hypothetical protein
LGFVEIGAFPEVPKKFWLARNILLTLLLEISYKLAHRDLQFRVPPADFALQSFSGFVSYSQRWSFILYISHAIKSSTFPVGSSNLGFGRMFLLERNIAFAVFS